LRKADFRYVTGHSVLRYGQNLHTSQRMPTTCNTNSTRAMRAILLWAQPVTGLVPGIIICLMLRKHKGVENVTACNKALLGILKRDHHSSKQALEHYSSCYQSTISIINVNIQYIKNILAKDTSYDAVDPYTWSQRKQRLALSSEPGKNFTFSTSL